MSADDTYVVSRLHRTDENAPMLWGVFHIMGEDNPAEWYIVDNAIWVFNNPIAAIVQGHKTNTESYAEYGCYVNSYVLHDIKDFFDMNTNYIVKAPR